MSEQAIEDQLESDIDAWVDAQLNLDPDCVPDFWDDMQTSRRLADYLSALGYRRSSP